MITQIKLVGKNLLAILARIRWRFGVLDDHMTLEIPLVSRGFVTKCALKYRSTFSISNLSDKLICWGSRKLPKTSTTTAARCSCLWRPRLLGHFIIRTCKITIGCFNFKIFCSTQISKQLSHFFMNSNLILSNVN